MTTRILAFAAALAACSLAWPAEFGVMESADPVERRHIKFIAYPIAVEARPHREQDTGVSVGVGYGLSDRSDVELQMANFDDHTFVGTDFEYVLRNGDQFDTSLAAGLHYGEADFGDQWGYDVTAIMSLRPPGSRVTLNAALDFADDRLNFRPQRVAEIGGRHQNLHAVPGVQIAVSRDVDLIGEMGLALSDDARNYAALGLSVYFR